MNDRSTGSRIRFVITSAATPTVAINAGSARAMRAPGHPQASFGMESIIDEMALALNMDPLELRIKNDPSEIRREQFRIAGERFGWKANTAPRALLLGL